MIKKSKTQDKEIYEHLKRLYSDKIYHELESLIGVKVTSIKAFYKNRTNEGYIIHFSNGKSLTAQSGECGNNAFCLLNKVDLDYLNNST